MLSLTRRPGESIFIYPSEELPADMTVAELFGNEKIEVRVVDARSGSLRLAINAPKELDIMRNELIS